MIKKNVIPAGRDPLMQLPDAVIQLEAWAISDGLEAAENELYFARLVYHLAAQQVINARKRVKSFGD